MADLQVAIFGLGRISGMHLQGWQATPGVEITCLVDREPARIQRAKETYHLDEAETFTDCYEALEKGNFDAVSICLPDYLHQPVALAALKARKHVLCEKPLARRYEEAKAMVQAAEASGCVNMVGFCRRFQPEARRARELLLSGEAGEVYHFRCHLCVERISYPEVRLEWRLQDELGTYGALGDLASHGLDWARFLVEPVAGRIVTVQSQGTIFIKQRRRENSEALGEVTAYDAISMSLGFEKGAQGVIEVSRFAPGEEYFQLDCSRLSLRYTGKEGLQVYYKRGSETQATASQWQQLPVEKLPPEEPLSSEFAQFAFAVKANRPASPDFADGAAVNRLLDALRLADVTGRRLTLQEE